MTQDSETKRHLTRRNFLKLGTMAATVGLLQACSPAAAPTPAPQPTAAKPAAQAPTAAPRSQPTAAPTKAPATPTTPAGPKRGGTFTMARSQSIIEFNPLSLMAGHFGFTRAMFNTLAHYDDNLQLQPELAEKWAFSSDGKELSLSLRQGVKYHSGREFTSDDVKYSVEFGQTDDQSTMRTLFKTIKGVETPDKYTVVFKFDGPNPGIFDALDTLYMLDKETIADRAKTAVGTGPFKFDKYVPNDRVEMVAFKDYWDKPKPYLDKYIARQIPDLASLAINLESGAVDAIWQPSMVDLKRLKDSGKYAVDPGDKGAMVYSVMINTQVKPLSDKRVRQAIAWSIDRKRFCETILLGLAQPSCLMWPRNSWAYFPDLEGKVGYDLDKAKGLLKEAGVGDGFETEILVSSKLLPPAAALAQIIQADLKKIGINAKIVDQEPTQFQNRITKAGDTSIVCHGYGRNSRDPGTLVTGAVFWYTYQQGGVATKFESAEYEQLVEELQSTVDQEKRKQTARKIQELALDECFNNPVGPNQRGFAYAPFVKGFSYNIDYAPNLADIWLDK
ncbi:MAG: ABC transporter substrate-binding protein [Dehalococcoidales bacterium]|nr:ABC transporter substrate-binding protein [Dehalococcoidales bacterium]